MRKTHTWHDCWNDVLRNVIFSDAELRNLLLIPIKEQKDIRAFISRYFVEDAMPDVIMTDEKVRVIYYETEGSKLNNDPHITKKYLEFDIYVKEDSLYNISTDRLCRRDKKISQRLKELLTGSPYVCGLRFTWEDDYHLGAKTVGYRRFHTVFSYKQTS